MIRTVWRQDPELEQAWRDLGRNEDRIRLMVGGRELEVTDLERPLWPGEGSTGVTKRDYLRYLIEVSPYLLPHLRGRPITPTHCPQGIDGVALFGQIGDPPPFVRTIRVWSAERDEPVTHLLISDLATLLWLGEQCAVEFFPWLSRVGTVPSNPASSDDPVAADETAGLWFPDFLVVNLDWRRAIRDGADDDPATDQLAFRRVADVALDLRSVANALGLRSFVKTSGRRGLHCYLPLDRRLNYTEVRIMAEMIGQFLVAVRPRNSTRTMTLLARSGFISVDHNQNMWGKVLIAPYSLRRHPGATVSTPLDWTDLEAAHPSRYTIKTVPDLLAERGDPWAEVLVERSYPVPELPTDRLRVGAGASIPRARPHPVEEAAGSVGQI